MEKIIILLVVLVCLFAPMSIFAITGYKALVQLGKRPSEGNKVLMPFLFKNLAAVLVGIVILMVLLVIFGSKPGEKPVIHFQDYRWQRVK